MCYRIEIAKTKTGIVEMCSSKRLYRLTFNNIMLTFNERSIQTFLFSVSNCNDTVSHDRDRKNRFIGFDSVVNSISFKFSVPEVEELKYLIETAVIESEIYFALQN